MNTHLTSASAFCFPASAARAELDEPEVRAKALYALSALARAPGLGQHAFIAGGGVGMLTRILVAPSEPITLRKKALLLVTDLASARAAESSAAASGGGSAGPGRVAAGGGSGGGASGEDGALPLLPALREPALLRAITALLAPPAEGAPADDDLTEKVLRAMRVYLSAEAPVAAAAAGAFLRAGAHGSLEALRHRLTAALAAEAAEAAADGASSYDASYETCEEGSYYGDLAALRDDVAAALRAAAPPPHHHEEL
jgi:hypothetical protein